MRILGFAALARDTGSGLRARSIARALEPHAEVRCVPAPARSLPFLFEVVLSAPGSLIRALTSDADGGFHFESVVAEPCTIPHDGPVGRMLHALGRHPWRPAHLHFMITAPGYRRLVTHVFRKGDQYLDSDAMFGVRSSLVADWQPHASGRCTPDGQTSAVPFTTLDFAFVLDATTTSGAKP